MCKTWRALSFILLIVLADTVIQAQDFQNYAQINYTIEEGLPSNECHQLLQDSLGYIWIATDRGLVRYDGYDFKTYGIRDGLKDISCLNICLDKKQNIWILTFSGRVYKYDPSLDACVPYEYQSTLDTLLRVTNIYDLAISEDLTLSFVIVGVGVLDISESGRTELHRGEFVEGEGHFVTKIVNENNILIVGVDRDGASNYEKRNKIKIEYINGKPFDIFQIQHQGFNIRGLHDGSMHTSSNKEAFQLLDGIDLLSLYGVNYFFESDTVIIRKHQSEIEDLIIVNDSSFISSEVNHKGVNFYKNYTDLLNNEKSTLIEGVSATCNLLDTDGNLWVSTLDQGLFKMEQKQVKLSPQRVRNTGRITNVETGHQGIYFTKEKNELYTSRPQAGDSLILFDASNRIHSLAYDGYTEEIIISKEKSFSYSSKQKISRLKYINNHSPFDTLRVTSSEVFVLSDTEYLISSVANFFIYTDLYNLPYYHSYSIEKPMRVLGAARVDSGNYLLGTTSGLVQFYNNKTHKIENRPEILSARINEIKQVESKYFFATQGNGLVVWDREDFLVQLTKRDGLVSDNIENIFVDKEDNLYLSTKSGLSRVTLTGHNSFSIRNFTTMHGLPSNDVYDVTEWNDTLFIGTAKGIGLLYGRQELAKRQKVFIDGVMVNDSLRLPENLTLDYNENNLAVVYKTIDYGMHAKIDYRYRLNAGPWTLTNSTSTNLTALPPDDYLFEVQSKNKDDLWSEASAFRFIINPPWWRTWWFFTLWFCGFGLLAFAFYKQRTNFLKRKLEVEREIRNLERAALQAQMNPHFIFNCLNSIQGFIMKNKKEEAMEYLSKFATLIRGTLNASAEDLISIDQEVRILENYLALEKLRFNNSFEYSVQVDKNIEEELLRIPPMLIQPFVENAIIHGMKNKDGGGLIHIDFSSLSANELEVVIYDNGSKRELATRKSTLHKSYGMSITSKRLAHNNSTKDKNFTISPRYTDEGTYVSVLIKV